jgi:hypothetical protein
MCLFTKLKSSWVYRAGDDVSVTHFEQLFLHISRTIRLGVHLKRFLRLQHAKTSMASGDD